MPWLLLGTLIYHEITNYSCAWYALILMTVQKLYLCGRISINPAFPPGKTRAGNPIPKLRSIYSLSISVTCNTNDFFLPPSLSRLLGDLNVRSVGCSIPRSRAWKLVLNSWNRSLLTRKREHARKGNPPDLWSCVSFEQPVSVCSTYVTLNLRVRLTCKNDRTQNGSICLVLSILSICRKYWIMLDVLRIT